MGEVRIVDPVTGGAKGQKPERFDLLPWDALEEVARVYAAGAAKYEDHNWLRGYKWSLSAGALGRHFARFMLGEERDPETGCMHLACVAFHALTLITFALRGRGTDDRALDGLLAEDEAADEPVPYTTTDVVDLPPVEFDRDGFEQFLKDREPSTFDFKVTCNGITQEFEAASVAYVPTWAPPSDDAYGAGVADSTIRPPSVAAPYEPKVGDWVRIEADESSPRCFLNGRPGQVAKVYDYDAAYVRYGDRGFGSVTPNDELTPWSPRVGERIVAKGASDWAGSECVVTGVEADGYLFARHESSGIGFLLAPGDYEPAS